MSRSEFEANNPYRSFEIIQYDERFAEAVEGMPPEHVDAALTNSLIANRIIEDAELAKVLDCFAQKYAITTLPHMIEPSFGFIRQSKDQLYAFNTVDLHWFNKNGGPNCQASIAIIDGAKMGGYFGARTQGTLVQQAEVFASVFRSTTPLPLAPKAYGVLTDASARKIREIGTTLLEDKCKIIEVLSVLSTQADFTARNLHNVNPHKVM